MNRKVHVNDQLSPNSIFLVGKVTGDEVVFLRDPMFVLDGTLQSIFGTSSKVFGDLRILSEPHEKSWHSQDKNVTPIYKFKKVGRYRILILLGPKPQSFLLLKRRTLHGALPFVPIAPLPSFFLLNSNGQSNWAVKATPFKSSLAHIHSRSYIQWNLY